MIYSSKAGYFGGFILLITAYFNVFIESTVIPFQINRIGRNEMLLFYILLCLVSMIIFEWYSIKNFNRTFQIETNRRCSKKSLFYLIKSSVYRVFAVSSLFTLAYIIVQNHYYFQHKSFNFTRSYFQYLLAFYWLGGVPYCIYTLKYKGGSQYELNDYGILFMISYRALFKLFQCKLKLLFNKKHTPTKTNNFLKNRRVLKVYLVLLVNFFFLTLMTKFFVQEYSQFHLALTRLLSDSYAHFNNVRQFHTWYLVFYHLIFYIDVGIAIIGYTIASRWLNNRTISVDMSLYGWFVVLLCYPPMNAGFTDQFIGYARLPTYDIVTSDILKMVLMSLILVSFSIYLWATMALGFKFSNLTNRGIISHGPYRFMRHPAYASKNLAWWLDNTHLLSNIWSSMALLIWNVIYMLRGITEEQHLLKDKHYKIYINKVTTRFIPNFSRS